MRLFFLIFLLLFLGCTSKSSKIESENGNEPEYIGGFTIVNHALNDSIIFSECHITLLETNDDSFIREISRIYKTNDHVFILDKSLGKLCIFDNRGKYCDKIENIGQGPHEYVSLMDFCLDPKKNEILLLCDKPYKIMRFSYDGQFVSETKLQDFFKGIVMDADYIYCNRSELNKTDLDKYEICCMNRNGELVDNLLETRDNITNTLFNSGNFLNKSKHIYYNRRFDNIVYQIMKDKFIEKYTLDFGKFNLPEHLLKESNIIRFHNECKEKKYIYSITEFIENEKYIIFLTNQAICVYDKNRETFIGYPRIKNTQFNIETNSFYSNGYDENSIVLKIEPGILYMFKEQIKDNEDIAALLGKVQEDDNPILLFYQFKI